MAVRKLPSGRFQAVLEMSGRICSRTFNTRLEAQKQLVEWKQEKKRVRGVLPRHSLTVDDFFSKWMRGLIDLTPKEGDSGWRKMQQTLYRKYVQPCLGKEALRDVSSTDIANLLSDVAKVRGFQTQRHVYVLVRHMFSNAQQDYHLVIHNPVLPKLKPPLPRRESPHLSLGEVNTLLTHIEGKPFELAIWIQLYLGLRVGELIALRWEHLNLEEGRVQVGCVYVRKTQTMRTYPKGGKWTTKHIPPVLLDRLRKAKREAEVPYVCPAPTQQMLSYEWYCRTLKQYCKEAGIRIIGTHGLRHTTASLYMHHGATKDDLRDLFSHSSLSTTERYCHSRGTHLEAVANRIQST